MIIIENEGKINFKKIIFKGLAIKVILISIIVTILLSAFAWKVSVDDGSYKEDKRNTGHVVKQKVGSKTQNIVAKDNGWSIDIDIEATVDEIIEELDKNNGVLDKYIGEGKQKEYLKTFIKAELITQYPDLRSNFSNPVPEGEFQGCIQIYRALSDGTTRRLTYVSYETFSQYIDNSQSEVTNHFSLDSEGNIVVAGWRRTTTNITSNEPNVENVTNQVDYAITTKSIPYKSSVAEYSMPFDFLWALTVSGRDAQFAYNIAQLALNSEIIITVQENLTTIVTENTEKYEIQERDVQKADFQVTYDDDTTYPSHEKKSDIETPYKTEKNIKTEICSVKANITKADTWIQKYENTYSNVIPEGSGEPIPGEPQKIDDTQFVDTGVALEVDDAFVEESAKAMEDYLTELCGGEKEYKEALLSEKCVLKINSMTHKKYSRKINHEITTTTTTTTNTYTMGTPTVTEKVDKNASEDNFVTLFIDSESARANILSAPDWLITMLESSSSTSNMVDLVKYLLYKATDINYGVTSFKISLIDLNEFKSVKGNSTENYIKAWENAALWEYETKQSSYLPTKYLSEDELYYIVYEDGSAGHNNIAYGWATFITDSNNIRATHQEYGGGYYNWKNEFAAGNIIVEDLYEGALVDKQKATAVFQAEILPYFQNQVTNYLNEQLSEYKFSQAQKDSLISICYQYGNISGFADAYINSLNEEGKINPEKLKENYSRFNYSGTVGDRKYANWLLFTQETYIDRSGNEITLLGGDIISTAKIIHDYISDPAHLYYYCLIGSELSINEHKDAGINKCGLNNSFEESQISGNYGYRLTCCATFVSWVLEECGYIETHYNGCSGLLSELQAQGWTRIDSYDDLEAGDIVFMDTEGVNNGSIEHVQIYVGDGCWYNTGGNWSIHQVEPYSADESAEFVCAYRKN
ncbi:MAG: hypothetical protein IJE68_01200 [Clostridia bacterium]|nr:hypothetical protein [Clostridia bacterium]